MKATFALIRRGDTLHISLDGIPYSVTKNHPHYAEINAACNDENFVQLSSLLTITGRLEKARTALKEQGLTIEGDQVLMNDIKLPLDLSKYLRAAIDHEQGVIPIVRFIQNLMKNPSHDVRQKLFGFMNQHGMPITNDGGFMAYKVVTRDYLDKHTKTIGNRPGTGPVMLDWDQVDTDPSKACSRGYHACALRYAKVFYNTGDRVVSIVVKPEDIGSVPDDYDGQKVRCRAYRVIADITEAWLGKDESLHTKTGIDPARSTRDECCTTRPDDFGW